MSAVPASVAAVRSAVRAAVADLEPGDRVLAAVSGGADSLALALGLAFVAPRAGIQAGAVVVDHQLQEGSAGVAAAVAETLHGLALDPVEVVAVDVGGTGGPEAAARAARYAALDAAAERWGAGAVLLGHTRDDQAETVLLGLARGSGARSLSGMAPVSGVYRRPLLGLPRAVTAACCAESGLVPWRDPHNDDPAYSRVRVRQAVLPAVEAALGPGIPGSLARTADLLRDDDAALEEWAERVLLESTVTGMPAAGVDVAVLGDAPAAVRRRALRRFVAAGGARPGALTFAHLHRLDALVAAWQGQGPVDLPGGVRVARRCGRLYLADDTAAPDGAPAGPRE